jgi:hypothetical protein
MKGYYANKPIGYFDLKYRFYPTIDTQKYGISLSEREHISPYHDNILVNHIFGSIDQRSTERSPLGESIDDIFKDRLALIRSKMELILLQLDQRKQINQDVLYRIDLDSCQAQTLIFEMGDRSYMIGRDRLSLEKIKFDLESQKRLEEVSYFRDSGLLNKDLKDTLIQYLSEVQKSKILGMEEEK